MAEPGVLTFGSILVVTVPDDLHDELALSLQRTVASRLRAKSRGVVLDISNVTMIDTFIARVLVAIGESSRLMGAQTVVTGMRPAVAMTLVELGMSLEGLQTALTIEEGVALARARDDDASP